MLVTITMMIMMPTWQCADASVDATQFVASLSFPLSGNISRESLSSICATFSIPRPRIIFSRDSIHDYFSPDSTALPRMSALAYHKIYHRPKKKSMRRKKLMKKWILVQNWRSPLGASLASSSRLFVHFGQKEFFTSSVFTFLHFVHFGQKKVFSQDLYLHFCQCCPFSGMGDELTSGGNQNTELETFRRHSSKQS